MSVSAHQAVHAPSTLPSCARNPQLFLHPLLEDGSASGSAQRREQQALRDTAQGECERCPLLGECLFRAIVEHDVAGFVAGTTEHQRSQIRARLGIQVQADDLSAWAGMRENQHRIGTDDVLALRAQRPDDSLKQLALHLGCSLSTVKRHLRAHRSQVAETLTVASQPSAQRTPPTIADVLAAREAVVAGRSGRRGEKAA